MNNETTQIKEIQHENRRIIELSNGETLDLADRRLQDLQLINSDPQYSYLLTFEDGREEEESFYALNDEDAEAIAAYYATCDGAVSFRRG